MTPTAVSAALGPIEFSDDETWFEYQDGGNRRRIGFHDYAAIYSVPGLYERVFYEELGMCTAEVVVGAFANALRQIGRDPAAERVLDVGAGNGIGGDQLRAAGVGQLVGLDLEPVAAAAAERDRPGVYDDYLVADLTDLQAAEEERMAAHDFTAVVALSAVGVGHLPASALERVLGLLDPGGVFAFAVTPALMPGSEDPAGAATGYPGLLERLLDETTALAQERYVHRRQTDGTPHDAIALVGRMP